MFNERQLLGLELSARAISELPDGRVRRALITNLSDLLRYQNMLCRYDAMALKVLDIFSIHGFPVSLIQCEANLLGVVGTDGGPVGSGGWRNIIEKYLKAKAYCEQPYEFRVVGRRTVHAPVQGEWIGDRRGEGHPERETRLECRDARSLDLPPESVDAILTDPPYFGNVQYAELMEFCYIWIRKLAGSDDPALTCEIRNQGELTGNVTSGRGLEDFTAGLSQVFRRAAAALKRGLDHVPDQHGGHGFGAVHDELPAGFEPVVGEDAVRVALGPAGEVGDEGPLRRGVAVPVPVYHGLLAVVADDDGQRTGSHGSPPEQRRVRPPGPGGRLAAVALRLEGGLPARRAPARRVLAPLAFTGRSIDEKLFRSWRREGGARLLAAFVSDGLEDGGVLRLFHGVASFPPFRRTRTNRASRTTSS